MDVDVICYQIQGGSLNCGNEHCAVTGGRIEVILPDHERLGEWSATLTTPADVDAPAIYGLEPKTWYLQVQTTEGTFAGRMIVTDVADGTIAGRGIGEWSPGEKRMIKKTLAEQFATLDDPEHRQESEPLLTVSQTQPIDAGTLGPPLQSRLRISRELVFVLTTPRPNIWCRFWCRVLLGFRWEKMPT